jgi:glutathione S-transferase
MIELLQAEWCPYSSLVRQRLTELGVDYVIRQVPPRPDQRDELRERTGQDTIPVVILEDGSVLAGDTDAIVAALDEHFPAGEWAREHREQALGHGAPVPAVPAG